MTSDQRWYACCPHCADAAEDHVEYGGTVEKDSHDVACPTCEYEQRVRPLLAAAFDEGVRQMSRALQGGPEPVNPYRPEVATDTATARC